MSVTRFNDDLVTVLYQPTTAYDAAFGYLTGVYDFAITEAVIPEASIGTRCSHPAFSLASSDLRFPGRVYRVASNCAEPYNGTQFPMIASGLGIIYNLPGLTEPLRMNG